jgi:GT2 family glycosyltransferase
MITAKDHRQAAPHPNGMRSTATAPTIDGVRIHMLDVELSEPLPPVGQKAADGRTASRAWLLVRLFGEPLGIERIEIPPAGVDTAQLTQVLRDHWADSILARGSTPADPASERLAVTPTPFVADHRRHLATAAPVSVVVCTRDRPVDLARCLQSLTEQDHPRLTVWLVDSAPRTDATRDLVDTFADRLALRYVHEPAPGLSRARNRALAQDLDDLVAWLDDDEVADPNWLSELTRALEARPQASGVSGMVVPAELESTAQIWFEQFGGHSKGRGFTAQDFTPDARPRQHPLFPLPAFGVGANMAFRTSALRRLGGFDPALGAGTRTRGGEDTRMFSEILRRGGTTLYRPSALTRHYHRRDLEGLTAQMRGYGTGLTAFYAAMTLDDPRVAVDLIRLAGRAARALLPASSVRAATLEPDFPRELLRENRRGMVTGPILYLRQRAADRSSLRDGAPC